MKKSILLLTISMFLFGLAASAQSSMTKPDYQSMFIYNFIGLVEWPSSYKTGDFVIGVYGKNPILESLARYMAKKRIGSQKIQITRFKTLSEIKKCHIIFIPAENGNEISRVVAKVKKYNTLIITDSDNALNKGSAINFIMVNNRLKYKFNKNNALNHGLKINRKLEQFALKH